MVTVAIPTDQRVVLHNVSWETYESLVANDDRSSPRMTYDRGVLELMSPRPPHELATWNAAFLVRYVATELGLRVRDVVSMTYKRSRAQRCFEADSSFDSEPSENARAGRTINISVDPPPNLVIEIDASRTSFPKLDLFAQLGVFKVWVWEDSAARFFILTDDGYVTVDRSHLVPIFTPEIPTGFLIAAETNDSVDWHQAVKNWVRTLS